MIKGLRKNVYCFTFHLICPCMEYHKISHVFTMEDAADLFGQMVDDGMPFIYVEQDGEYRTYFRNDCFFTFH
jgi:hypothetical protein